MENLLDYNLIIYDFDVPRLEDGFVTCLELTEDVLKET